MPLRATFSLKLFAHHKVFARHTVAFARLFQKAVSSTDSGGRAPQSAKSYFGVFFLIAFSFAPVYAKEKADRHKSFVLTVEGTWGFIL